MKKRFLLFFLVLLIVPFSINAQTKTTVSGTIKDQDGEALIGASVVQKGTSNGTITDVVGHFSIQIDANSTLVFSYMGYNSQEIKITNQKNLNVVLNENNALLDEVVVVGFGTQKRRDIVGSISSVSEKEIKTLGATNVLQALQGAVSGVRIDNPASPTGEPDVRIRGLNTLTSTNASPLYIVDGVPFYDMRSLDPNDIQSVEVLKDASATAIYGSQAANGVLLITTKRGSKGKPSVSASFSYSLQNPVNELDLMNGEEYIAFKREVLRYKASADYELVKDDPDALAQRVLNPTEYNQWATGMEVDPYEMMINKNAPIAETSISVSGGEDKAKYYVGVNYLDNQGLVRSTYFNRFSVRSNIDLNVTKGIRLSNYTNIFQYKSSDLDGGSNGLTAMYRLSPYSVMSDENGDHTIYPMPEEQLFGNPLSDAYDIEKSKKRFGVNNLSIIHIDLPWVKGLSAEAKYQFEIRQQKDGRFAFTNTREGVSGGTATRQYQDWNKWYAEGLINYNRQFGKHSIDATAMMSAEYRDYESSELIASGIPVADYLWYSPESATLPLTTNTGYNERSLIGQMFRANYNYASKYYLTFTIRRDGFSGFSEGNKWAIFPSIALAWRINEESFLKNINEIDNLKLRLSYGQLGSQGVGVYETLAKLDNTAAAVFGKEVEPGYAVSALSNDLRWETTTATNIGLDFGFFRNRVFGSLELYNKISNDLLVSRNVPIMMGVTSLRDNAAKVQNRGIEISLTGSAVRTKNWEWQMGVNYSYNKNEIVEIYGKTVDDIDNRWFIGQPIGVRYTQKCVGLWQVGEEADALLYGSAPGKPKFEEIPDADGNIDHVINDKDRQIVGVTIPPYLLGLRTSLRWKSLTLAVSANGAFGHVKSTNFQYYNDPRFRNYNFSYWTPETPDNYFPQPGTISGDKESEFGSLFTFKADWFKIKNITLNYDVPNSILKPTHLQSLSVYCSLQDYFSFYSYPFVDPETGSGLGSYPNNKEMKLGVRVAF